MAAGFTPAKKYNLENTSMYVYHTRNGFQSTSMAFEIKIFKFLMMKDNVSYTKPLSYKDWILNVLKKRKEVILTLRTSGECTSDVKCRVKYSNDFATKPVCANKISDYEHVIELPSKTIYDPENKFLKEDSLVCELFFDSRIDCRILRPTPGSKIEWNNESVLYMNQNQEKTGDTLMKDLREISWADDMRFTDFKIRTESKITKVNKGIIAARSKFFFDYLKKNPDSEELTIGTSYVAFTLALQFMYWGTFQVQDTPTMLELIKLAKMLQMKQLHEMCSNFVKHSICAGNVQLIRKIGSDIGEDELVIAADKFLTRK